VIARLVRFVSVVLLLALTCGCEADQSVEAFEPATNTKNWLTVVLNNPAGAVSVDSQSQTGVRMRGGFDSGIYMLGPDQHSVTVLLYEGELNNPTQAVTVRMFWRPKAGATPIDRTATNATIHYVIFTGEPTGDVTAGEQIGIYSGAGFLYPSNKPGGDRLTGGIWEANLRLSDHTEAFADLLGKAVIKGKFTARRDDLATDRALRRLNAVLRERLGYPRLVDAESSGQAIAASR